ncbi:HlyD family efflux transporter periplasmic adaptor subunit [Microvirga tunisiensis]|uniref:HlyD family efflux transporter periplasmic adaptor subunit n=1 Tax=Pannonibacter tanglangensis TaxID=2750084 RepID=A0A7X5J8S9_9HYPH|nr:HlyD family efflux transporter periplasmic adaptor subunit [Pannonibacter sp. XCT-53]NBN77791.1 HlyD family efflux transporter periplasmic adaptor subunit [Pannonibacter sp. XCT-53]
MTGRGRAIAVAIVALAAVLAGGWFWWQGRTALPEGLATANGRIEAETVQIASKTGGRVLEVLVAEGDLVRTGQVLARVDTSELEAMKRGAAAQEAAAREAVNTVLAQIVQRESELKYADQALERARTLLGNGHISQQEVDQRQTARETAAAALAATRAQLANAENTVLASAAEVGRIVTLIDDSTLTAPIAGRVQYRLAEPGEVIGAGGRVLTLLNLGDVYMTVFLPTGSVGRVLIGAEARIVLDAAPEFVIPATVSFVAADAQFTPREVETRSERDKLMFRVKLKIDPALLARHIDKVRTGLPGEAYVMMAPPVAWPAALEVRLPPAP